MLLKIHFHTKDNLVKIIWERGVNPYFKAMNSDMVHRREKEREREGEGGRERKREREI